MSLDLKCPDRLCKAAFVGARRAGAGGTGIAGIIPATGDVPDHGAVVDGTTLPECDTTRDDGMVIQIVVQNIWEQIK